MKWFEHHTNDRDQSHSKIIRAKFGAEGYGIFQALMEVIGENVQDSNPDQWGQVAKIHDLDSLAIECATSTEKLKQFLEFCNEKEIFEKKDGNLYSCLILSRLDNYAKRIKRVLAPTSDEQSTNKVQLSTNKVQLSTNKVQLSTTLQKQKQIQKQDNLDKSKLVQAPQAESSNPIPREDKRNPLVEHVISEFHRVYGFNPTDKKPRFVAHNLVQRIKTVTADRLGGELTQDRLKKGITVFFNWLQDQEGFEGIQKLETAKLKLNIFLETIPRKEQGASAN